MNADEINKAFDEEYIKYRDAFPKDYKLPKEWVGLTDEEIDATWGSWMRPYAHMVLNKLKEKNNG
jgi:protoheme ferro-lyase